MRFPSGRALNGSDVARRLNQSNSEYLGNYLTSQTCGAKLVCLKGNSPDFQLRSLIYGKWLRMSRF